VGFTPTFAAGTIFPVETRSSTVWSGIFREGWADETNDEAPRVVWPTTGCWEGFPTQKVLQRPYFLWRQGHQMFDQESSEKVDLTNQMIKLQDSYGQLPLVGKAILTQRSCKQFGLKLNTWHTKKLNTVGRV